MGDVAGRTLAHAHALTAHHVVDVDEVVVRGNREVFATVWREPEGKVREKRMR